MKSFILTFAMISYFLLSQGLSLQSTMTPATTTQKTLPTTSNVTSSDASPASPSAVEVPRPLGKAVPSAATTTTIAPAPTKGPGQQCKEIGSACSVSDECCSRRCTSYRRRCVY
ncbi:uncharacterized protein LOC129916463 [Episyrphus balteatus]|uniref:uncharacterized protein LOC129916463 n=1 Tax=Episyrphus balteatus TaxID=286459 RepID=UPI002485298D|nr:uncharacterized protein LOC129916463 [Episyrphus balteatus]